jgi:hypothetical protein
MVPATPVQKAMPTHQICLNTEYIAVLSIKEVHGFYKEPIKNTHFSIFSKSKSLIKLWKAKIVAYS